MHTYGNYRYVLFITCGENNPIEKGFDKSVTEYSHKTKAFTTCNAEIYAKNHIGKSDLVSASILTKERGN